MIIIMLTMKNKMMVMIDDKNNKNEHNINKNILSLTKIILITVFTIPMITVIPITNNK